MEPKEKAAAFGQETRGETGKFDPSKYLTSLKGKAYLEVKYRLLWLRTEHPEARIETELVEHGPDYAVMKATVTIPDFGSATGYGMETRQGFHDFLEKAETKALGRALAHLGYGTQFAPEVEMVNPDGTPHLVDSPVGLEPAASGRSYGSGYRRPR
jgi:hypothetical protein